MLRNLKKGKKRKQESDATIAVRQSANGQQTLRLETETPSRKFRGDFREDQ
jgi:hypothetical protein